ncbi:uncharacterized protein LOC119461853 [Dermacentor silvarum]|uniref:uncharacterized protein LOC119461853 n=1 Tax=Dermacentor silvarum TaxID=543639 RepID=UPI0018999CA8|nr:uncharacterized protein LOC119461853 [Dermacentor silvarum]
MADGGGTNEMMQALLEQNRRLLELIERKPEAFHIMPDLNKAIQDFDGEGSCHEAGAWLKSIDSMAVLHGWPDSFRLENRLHGYQPRMQDGILRWLNTENNEWVCPEQLQEMAQKDIASQQARSKQYFDKRHFTADKLSVGDIVVMRCVPERTGAPTKTQKKFRGPLTVIEVLPADTYRVTEMNGRKRVYSTTAHISQLKRWGGRCQEQFDQSSSDEEESVPRRSTRVSKRPAYLRDYTT